MPPTLPASEAPTLPLADIAVILAYLTFIMVLGSLFYRRKTSSVDYFFAGHRMTWIPVCMSVIASHVSAITYLGTPAFVYRRNLETFPMVLMLPLVVLPLVIRYFVPFFHSLGLNTAYEYLERRFDLRVRTAASLLFLVLRGIYMGIVIYAPALVLSVVAGLPLVPSILLTGVLTTIYTTLGGMKAVVWTDLIQATMLFVGVGTIAAFAYRGVGGGLPEIWHAASELGTTKLIDFSFDLTREFTAWAVLFGAGFFILSSFATDQIIIQRYMTARSAAECQSALKLQAVVLIPVTLCLQAIGLLLAVHYSRHPEQAAGMPSPDAVLPHFVVRELPIGVRGLVIASVFAAAMSTMSGGINALTTASVFDFYKRLFRPDAADGDTVRVARIATVAWGALATVMALYAAKLGELANAYNRVNSFVGGVILGIFLLGMLTRRPDGTAALAGAAAGLLAVVSVATLTPVSWLFYGVVGCGVTFWVGAGFPSRKRRTA